MWKMIRFKACLLLIFVRVCSNLVPWENAWFVVVNGVFVFLYFVCFLYNSRFFDRVCYFDHSEIINCVLINEKCL